MPLARQAKTLSPEQQQQALEHVSRNSRYPLRDRVVLLLSYKAGLRAKEIVYARWSMVLDSAGAASGTIADSIRLTNAASKGHAGGREIPLERSLRDALQALYDEVTAVTGAKPLPQRTIIDSERGRFKGAASLVVWFHRLYKRLGFEGASSHSGRRTFGTNAARAIVQAGGSLRDVQDLLGHASLATTQRYIDVNTAAKRRVVEMV